MSRDVFHRSHLDRDDWDERGPEYEEEDADSGDEAPKGGDSSGLDDLASHTEADSLADSDHDGDEAEKAVDELEDLSSDSDSVQDVESEADVSDNNDD